MWYAETIGAAGTANCPGMGCEMWVERLGKGDRDPDLAAAAGRLA